MPPSRAMAIAIAGLGDLVHRRRHERDGELDVGGERRRRVDRVGQHLAVAGDDDDVVEREGFEAVEQLSLRSSVLV